VTSLLRFIATLPYTASVSDVDDGTACIQVVPWREYKRLVSSDVEGALTDEELYDLAKSAGGESFPATVVDRLLAGESPIRVYRDHRRLTQKQLVDDLI